MALSDMKVFVAGGTGAIGGHAVPALVRSGHQVTALARTPEKAALLSKLGVRPVIASIMRVSTVAASGLGGLFLTALLPASAQPEPTFRATCAELRAATRT